MGDRTVHEIKTEFEQRAATRELIQVAPQNPTPARQFTTPEMTALERQNIGLMRQGQGTARPLAAPDIRRDVDDHSPHLSAHQRAAVARILSNTDQVQALEGVAGSGKTTVLGAVRDAATREGYHVEGMAPTSRAAQKLGESGIPTTTLQRHLAKEPDAPTGKRLYVAGRVQSRQHQADARVSRTALHERPRAPGGRCAPTRSRGRGTAVSATPGGRHRHRQPGRHRAPEGSSSEDSRRGTLARRSPTSHSTPRGPGAGPRDQGPRDAAIRPSPTYTSRIRPARSLSRRTTNHGKTSTQSFMPPCSGPARSRRRTRRRRYSSPARN